MRLTIEHRTIYRFSAPQGRLTQLLRLTPEDSDDQSVADWQIHVDCDARMRPGRDGFGNRVTMLYVEGPIDGIDIAVSGEVLTSPSDAMVRGTSEPLPPALFLRSTPLTPSGGDLAAFAADSVAGLVDPGDRLHALNRALHTRFEFDPGRPDSGRTAAQAFARDEATPRDRAQMFVAGARSLNIPARYVSGYSTQCFGRGAAPAPHGWAEAHIDGLGWFGFDPSTGSTVDEGYVRVATALDAAGAAAVAGSRLGDGEEELDVDLHVGRASPQE